MVLQNGIFCVYWIANGCSIICRAFCQSHILLNRNLKTLLNPNLTPKVRETIQANIKAEQQRLAEEKAQKEAELLEKERIKTAIRWVVGLAIAAGLIFLIIRYWHTISVILIVIFVLFILIK